MNRTQLKSELGIGDIIGHAIIWLLLVIVTIGLAAFVYPYYLNRFVISKTYLVDENGNKTGKLICTIDLASIIGKIVIWFLLTIITLGLAYVVFVYKILSHCIDHTKITDQW